MSKFIKLTQNKKPLIIRSKSIECIKYSPVGVVWIYFCRGESVSVDQSVEDINKLLIE